MKGFQKINRVVTFQKSFKNSNGIKESRKRRQDV